MLWLPGYPVKLLLGRLVGLKQLSKICQKEQTTQSSFLMGTPLQINVTTPLKRGQSLRFKTECPSEVQHILRT